MPLYTNFKIVCVYVCMYARAEHEMQESHLKWTDLQKLSSKCVSSGLRQKVKRRQTPFGI